VLNHIPFILAVTIIAGTLGMAISFFTGEYETLYSSLWYLYGANIDYSNLYGYLNRSWILALVPLGYTLVISLMILAIFIVIFVVQIMDKEENKIDR
jgi:hypothetical protein